MDKEMDASVSVSYGNYTVSIYEPNVTLLRVINSLCRNAHNQKRVIIRAEITMKPPSSIFAHSVEKL